MKRQSIYIILLVFLLSTISGEALAKPGKGKGKGPKEHKAAKVEKEKKTKGPKIKHRGMDTNGDGVISRSEWRGNDKSFSNHDCNGDGRLSGDEVRPGAKPCKKDKKGKKDKKYDIAKDEIREFGSLDRNGDGVISRGEWIYNRSIFTDLDVNGDGRLSPTEYEVVVVAVTGGIVRRTMYHFTDWVVGLWKSIW